MSQPLTRTVQSSGSVAMALQNQRGTCGSVIGRMLPTGSGESGSLDSEAQVTTQLCGVGHRTVGHRSQLRQYSER